MPLKQTAGAEKMRGRVMIINSEHEAGAKLLGLGGIAALLRYAIDESLMR